MSGNLEAGSVTVRKPVGAERRLFERRRGFMPLILDQQLEAGQRLSIAISWPRSRPLPDAAAAEQLLTLPINSVTIGGPLAGPGWFKIEAVRLEGDQ